MYSGFCEPFYAEIIVLLHDVRVQNFNGVTTLVSAGGQVWQVGHSDS